MIYMICYDIADSKRLAKVSKTLLNYGVRAQYSFFQCDLSKNQYSALVGILQSLIDEEADKLYIYPLCGKCIEKAVTQGTGQLMVEKPFEII